MTTKRLLRDYFSLEKFKIYNVLTATLDERVIRQTKFVFSIFPRK